MVATQRTVQHMPQFIFILGSHADHTRDMAQIGNMLKALNGKVAGEALVHIGINKAKGK